MKQVMTINELIDHMQERGIKFNIIKLAVAADFLRGTVPCQVYTLNNKN